MSRSDVSTLLGRSPDIDELLEDIRRFAQTEETVAFTREEVEAFVDYCIHAVESAPEVEAWWTQDPLALDGGRSRPRREADTFTAWDVRAWWNRRPEILLSSEIARGDAVRLSMDGLFIRVDFIRRAGSDEPAATHPRKKISEENLDEWLSNGEWQQRGYNCPGSNGIPFGQHGYNGYGEHGYEPGEVWFKYIGREPPWVLFPILAEPRDNPLEYRSLSERAPVVRPAKTFEDEEWERYHGAPTGSDVVEPEAKPAGLVTFDKRVLRRAGLKTDISERTVTSVRDFIAEHPLCGAYDIHRGLVPWKSPVQINKALAILVFKKRVTKQPSASGHGAYVYEIAKRKRPKYERTASEITRDDVLDTVREHPTGIAALDIMEVCGITKSTVYAALRGLLADGAIREVRVAKPRKNAPRVLFVLA